MESMTCTVPVGPGNRNTPTETPVRALPETLFVSTGLSQWTTHEPERIARDFQINDIVFRRLDPEYYAWLRSRMNLAQLVSKAGKLDQASFDELRERFNSIHAWAVAKFGESRLLDAMRSFDTRDYAPPIAEADTPRKVMTAGHRADETAADEALSQVDAIREQAIALGWRRERLYADGRRGSGLERGLVCGLRPGARIGEVTRQSIEIIGPPPMEVRQRFYNPDVEQPWVRRLT